MTFPTLTYDPDVHALYIQLSSADIVETVELSRTVYVDVDASGDPVGFEILNAEPSRLAKKLSFPAGMTWRDLVNPDAA
jgi:uncharacterized protein YuzE